MSKVEFHFGAVAVPRTSLTGEFAMLSSHLENGGKKETVLRLDSWPKLTQFTGDFHEFPGGMTEREHWKGAKSFREVMLNTAISEIDEELHEDSKPFQFTHVPEKIMVLQKRKDSYVFFLVSLFWWEMNIEEMAVRQEDRLPSLIVPEEYLSNRAIVKARPRDVAVATIYSKNYVDSLM